VLFHTKKDSIERTLTLSLAGLILFVPAMVLPIMTLNAMGIERTSNILRGIMTLFQDDFHLVAILVLLTAVIVPFLKLLLLFYVSISVRFKANLGNPALAFRFYKRLDEWGMLEVYMLGILVSITKLTDLAQVSYDVGLFCFVFLLIITLFSSVTLDKQQYWSLIGRNANTRNG
jgi:paraquat-inducible protein A